VGCVFEERVCVGWQYCSKVNRGVAVVDDNSVVELLGNDGVYCPI